MSNLSLLCLEKANICYFEVLPWSSAITLMIVISLSLYLTSRLVTWLSSDATAFQLDSQCREAGSILQLCTPVGRIPFLPKTLSGILNIIFLSTFPALRAQLWVRSQQNKGCSTNVMNVSSHRLLLAAAPFCPFDCRAQLISNSRGFFRVLSWYSIIFFTTKLRFSLPKVLS